MNFQVPQYVDLEDKLAFRLTLKQLGWFALGGFILFVFWTLFEKWVFWISFPFVVGGAAAFAFWRPAGLSLISFLLGGFRYSIMPKRLTWKKGIEDISLEDEYGKRELDTSDDDFERDIKRKKKSINKAGDLAKILDEKSDL
jgi:hypothetical protein